MLNKSEASFAFSRFLTAYCSSLYNRYPWPSSILRLDSFCNLLETIPQNHNRYFQIFYAIYLEARAVRFTLKRDYMRNIVRTRFFREDFSESKKDFPYL